MNGVRRFLGGGVSITQPPPPAPALVPAPISPPISTAPIPPPKPSWTPQDFQQTPPTNGKSTNGTPGLVVRKERIKPSQVASPMSEQTLGNASIQFSRSESAPASARSPAGSVGSYNLTSPTRSIPHVGSSALSSQMPLASLGQAMTPESSTGWRPPSGSVNIRDELLMSLLTSEAVVDSRECEILSAEEVEELKKEHHVLKTRLIATQKKLELETKIRDAALSLAKVNTVHGKTMKETEERLESAEHKVTTAQKELLRVSERTGQVHRKLLEHRAGVLGYSVHKMEKKIHPSLSDTLELDTLGAASQSWDSTMSSVASVPPTPSKFDGAHLFAGHADARVPLTPLLTSDITTLEANLRAATESLNEANKKNAELARELSHLRLEKEQMETTMSMDLQNAEDMVSALQKGLPQFEELQVRCDELTKERAQWEEDRQRLVAYEQEVERLERQLELLDAKSGETTEMERMLVSLREKADTDLQKKDEAFSALHVEYDEARGHWQAEKAVMEDELDRLRGGGEARVEVDGAIETLHVLMQHHRIDRTSRDASLQGLLVSVGAHLENLSAVTKEHDEYQAQMVTQLQAELEATQREKDDARREALALGTRVKELTAPSVYTGPPIEYKGDVADVIAMLQPVWTVLPAPELRSAKLGPPRHLRSVSTVSSPGGPHSKSGLPSLSDMDVRSLKALYDTKSSQAAVGGAFSLEAFAARVQALVIDDRALIERLIRFAQAHELLKKNAERAQKLAEESNAALGMYQKQVATLDDQNFALQNKQTALAKEIQALQAAVDRAEADRRDIEMHAAEQAETCKQLTEANTTLSAKTLTLAQEAASAPEIVRKQLEGQLDACQKALRDAREEVEAMRASEQTQRIALMDELNSMHTENANLKTQLRTLKK